MIKVNCTVPAYEVNGKEVEGIGIGNAPKIQVTSHWNRQTLVVLTIGDQSITLVASDLQAAIRNATNTQ